MPGLLMQAGSFLLKSEGMRNSVLSQLNADVSIPMKQFLRVDVTGIHEVRKKRRFLPLSFLCFV